MKILVTLLVPALMAYVGPGRAETLDLSNLKCSQFVQTTKETSSVISAWLVGYYTEVSQAEVIDLARVKDTAEKLSSFCTANPGFALSAAAEGLLGK